MNTAKRLLLVTPLATVLSFATTSQAATITLTPGTAGVVGHDCAGLDEDACIYTALGVPDDGSTLLYKDNVDSGEEGPFLAFYETVFANTETDPSDATIFWVGPIAIGCPACYLVIKDGGGAPPAGEYEYYFYNLSAWNGTDTIELRSFWPTTGAISHVSIRGFRDGPLQPELIPEPGGLILLGTGLVIVARRIRRRV